MKTTKLASKLSRLVCGRAKRGLYHGKTVRFGNSVSEDGGNKTRRKWSPNAKRKRLYSEILDRMIPIQVTSHALRCIDKAGGLDNYVLNTRAEKMVPTITTRNVWSNFREKVACRSLVFVRCTRVLWGRSPRGWTTTSFGASTRSCGWPLPLV